MCLRVHQPLRIAEHRDVEVGMVHLHAVDLREGDTQFWRTPRIQDHHIRLRGAEGLDEVRLFRLQVRQVIGDTTLFQLSAETCREGSLPTRRVVTVDKHGVIVLEFLQEMRDGGFVLLRGNRADR